MERLSLKSETGSILFYSTVFCSVLVFEIYEIDRWHSAARRETICTRTERCKCELDRVEIRGAPNWPNNYLSEGAASIRGEIAKAADGRLPSDLHVYLVPAEREKADDPLRYVVADVGSDGTFSFSNLPPGKYFTLARPTQADAPTANDKFRCLIQLT